MVRVQPWSWWDSAPTQASTHLLQTHPSTESRGCSSATVPRAHHNLTIVNWVLGSEGPEAADLHSPEAPWLF